MAREYAKILTRIWADSDFKRLSAEGQRLYFQVISQPDISMAGVVTLAEKRWSLQVSDCDEEHISAALQELEGRRFLVVDRGTQEVLVRSFVRSDECWKSPTSMKGVESAVRSVLSESLKAVIRDELLRIDLSKLSDKVSEKTGRSTKEYVEGIVRGIAEDYKGLSHGVSDTPLDTPTDGHKRISHSTEPEPEPTPEPTTTTRKSGAIAPAGAGYPDAFEQFWSHYPLKRDKGKALKAWKNAIKRSGNDTIIAGAIRYRDDPNRLDQYTKYAEGWLNGDGWEDDPLPHRIDHRQNKARDRFDDHRGVVAELAAMDYENGRLEIS